MSVKTFRAQYWFECARCPAKQFIYAVNFDSALIEIRAAGYSVALEQDYGTRFVLCKKCNGADGKGLDTDG